MGNRFSRRRDAPASCAAAAAEQKTEAGPARTNPELTQTQESIESERLDVMDDESGTTEASSPKHECVSGDKEVPSPVALLPKNDAEPESTVMETPPPVQIEPLISAIEPPEPEGPAQPALVAEAQLALKPEAEPSSHQDAEAEPPSEPAPTTAEPLEQHTDLLNQESLPEAVLPSPPLIDLSVPDVSSAPDSIPAPLNPGKSPNLSAAEHEGRLEPAGGSSLEPENFTETSEFVEKQMEVEAAGRTKTPGSDVTEENIRDVLKNLELEGSDLLNDLIQSEVQMPEDAPFTDVSASIELM